MKKTRELRLDYLLRSISTEGAPPDHPYIQKLKEKEEETAKPYETGMPEQVQMIDKGYRKILLVGYNGELIQKLEQSYKGTKVKKLEFFLANSTEEAVNELRKEKFDYILTAGLRADPDKTKGIKQKRYIHGILEEYVVPAILINGYDISFVAAHKNIPIFIYDPSVDETRAKLLSAIPARGPSDLECELKDHEKYHAFNSTRAARYEFIQALRKEKQERRNRTKTKEILLKNLAERMKIRCAFV